VADKQILATVVIKCKNKTRIAWMKNISILISKFRKLGIK
jgi:hypothetical protein